MNFIRLYANNGSVPSSDFRRVEIVYFENGRSELKILQGRGPEESIIDREIKQTDKKQFQKLLEYGKQLNEQDESELSIGGPEKLLEIKHDRETKKISVSENNQKAFSFFMQCLSVYNSNLKSRLIEIL